MRIVVSAVARSNVSGATSDRALASRSFTGPASASARGVGMMPCEVCRNSWSAKIRRSRFSDPDVVGWVTAAANNHLASSINAMNLKNRLGDGGLNRTPHSWHLRAGGGTVHSIRSGRGELMVP
jgi:hypothetical protein